MPARHTPGATFPAGGKTCFEFYCSEKSYAEIA